MRTQEHIDFMNDLVDMMPFNGYGEWEWNERSDSPNEQGLYYTECVWRKTEGDVEMSCGGYGKTIEDAEVSATMIVRDRLLNALHCEINRIEREKPGYVSPADKLIMRLMAGNPNTPARLKARNEAVMKAKVAESEINRVAE